MLAIILLIAGLFVGTFIGVTLMCLLQVNQTNKIKHKEDNNGKDD